MATGFCINGDSVFESRPEPKFVFFIPARQPDAQSLTFRVGNLVSAKPENSIYRDKLPAGGSDRASLGQFVWISRCQNLGEN